MIRILLCFIIIFPSLSASPAQLCNDDRGETRAWEDSPVHSEGLRLRDALEFQGLKVECMRRSTEEHLFKGQKGAAWVKTDRGILEAWFLPSGQTFEKLAIRETASRSRYVYSFSGMPHVPPTIDSSQPIAFIKDGSVLLEIWGNQELAAQLRQRFSRAQ